MKPRAHLRLYVNPEMLVPVLGRQSSFKLFTGQEPEPKPRYLDISFVKDQGKIPLS
jgi:hypothetical protein